MIGILSTPNPSNKFRVSDPTSYYALEGTEGAIDRARAFSDAGADILFVEAPDDVRAIEKIATDLAPLAPLIFKIPEGRPAPPLSFTDLADLGFSILILPIGTLLAATTGIQRSLRELVAGGTPVETETAPITFEGFTDINTSTASRGPRDLPVISGFGHWLTTSATRANRRDRIKASRITKGDGESKFRRHQRKCSGEVDRSDQQHPRTSAVNPVEHTQIRTQRGSRPYLLMTENPESRMPRTTRTTRTTRTIETHDNSLNGPQS